MLDAGHGGAEPGAVYNGRQEKDDNLNLTLAVGDILAEEGYDVLYTRTTDVYESPFEKAMEANESGADLFISIHRNAFPVPGEASGIESLVYDKSGLKLEVAESINAQLENIGFKNLGVKARPNLVVLRRTEMPSVLVEVGFLDSQEDNELFDENFNEIAQAIADGITDVIGPMLDEVESGPSYQVQVGLYKNKKYADELLAELLQSRYPAYITQDVQLSDLTQNPRDYYAVKVGNYKQFQNAIEMEQRLKQDGYQTIIVTS